MAPLLGQGRCRFKELGHDSLDHLRVAACNLRTGVSFLLNLIHGRDADVFKRL
jgi:hypothetical protein